MYGGGGGEGVRNSIGDLARFKGVGLDLQNNGGIHTAPVDYCPDGHYLSRLRGQAPHAYMGWCCAVGPSSKVSESRN